MEYINKANTWLYKNNELVIENLNIDCNYIDNIITYKEDNNINTIDILNELFIRENDDYKIIINNQDNKMEYIIKENNNSFFLDINSNFIINDKEILIEYNIEDESFNIKVQLL